jgi:hypothetical protein
MDTSTAELERRLLLKASRKTSADQWAANRPVFFLDAARRGAYGLKKFSFEREHR